MATRVMIVGDHAYAGCTGLVADSGDNEKLQGSFFVRVDPPRELGTPVSRRQAVVINGKEPEMVQVVSGRYNGMKGTVIGISGSSLELYFGDINPLKIEVPATDVVALEKMAVAG